MLTFSYPRGRYANKFKSVGLSAVASKLHPLQSLLARLIRSENSVQVGSIVIRGTQSGATDAH